MDSALTVRHVLRINVDRLGPHSPGAVPVDAWHTGDIPAVQALAAVLPSAQQEAVLVEADIAAQAAKAHAGAA